MERIVEMWLHSVDYFLQHFCFMGWSIKSDLLVVDRKSKVYLISRCLHIVILHAVLKCEWFLCPSFVENCTVWVDTGHDMPFDIGIKQSVVALMQQTHQTKNREATYRLHTMQEGREHR